MNPKGRNKLLFKDHKRIGKDNDISKKLEIQKIDSTGRKEILNSLVISLL